MLTIPAPLRGATVRPRLAAVGGVLFILVVAAVVLGIRVAWANAESRPHPVAASTPGGLVSRSLPAAFATSAMPSASASVTGGGVAEDAAATPSGVGSAAGGSMADGSVADGSVAAGSVAGAIVVHVVGQVRKPGVVRLGAGARVLDAVSAAGGATTRADLTRVNLARPVVDGEQIVVPKPGDPAPLGVAGAAGPGTDGTGTGSGPGGSAQPVNLNSADAAALDTLPGVGPVLAQRILDWRAEHGRFTSVDELGEVSGIGEKLLAQLGTRVTL